MVPLKRHDTLMEPENWHLKIFINGDSKVPLSTTVLMARVNREETGVE